MSPSINEITRQSYRDGRKRISGTIMNGKNKFTLSILLGVLFLACTVSFAEVIRNDGKTFIRDRKGENWEITQAVSIGFNPSDFEYGLGRNAFSPLDDTDIRDAPKSTPQKLRILGVPGENETKAFSIKKLKRHEIANSHIDDTPIAAAY
jgi:hypothetical protein